MTAVEVLAPLRLETRFVAPADRVDGVDEWLLRLRIYPDEFSIRRGVAPPSKEELDRVTAAVESLTVDPPVDVPAAFASLAAAVGAARAMWLWRTAVVVDGAGLRSVDRSAQAVGRSVSTHGSIGLPERLEVWLVQVGGRTLAAELVLDVAAIAADLQHSVFDEAVLSAGELPATWWLSYGRAVEVGLAVDLDVGVVPPVLDALVVVGVGDTAAADLVDAHTAAGRLAVLAPGTPTNTVEGEPTTDLGADPDSWSDLLSVDASSQQSTRAVLTALTGRVPPTALPMLGGDLDYSGPGILAVRCFWPVLWGRSLRDVTGAGANEVEAARWAWNYLAVEGSRPAVRVGAQPYGLLPTSVFERWVPWPDPNAPFDEVEDRILRWALPWRAGAAAAARRTGNGWVRGADTAGLLAEMSRNAPTRRWRVRGVADLHLVQAARALAGLTAMGATEWDRFTAQAWRDVPYPQTPKGPSGGVGTLPGPPFDEWDDPGVLRELIGMHPESLYSFDGRLGLVGHLFREALINGRAVIGEAISRWRAGDPVELGQPLPFEEERFVEYVMNGDDVGLEELRNTDDNGGLLADMFLRVCDALGVMADDWETRHDRLFAGVLAALDTASVRVDPWLTGLAERRLQRFISDGAPFLLGAYGWVDSPAPYAGDGTDALAPGPTRAGLLHAPSHSQALTAALLRDAAVRYPDEDRWQLGIDSAKVRAAVSLSERVRLGVHPYEALGLEVERLAGSWDVVRVLRQKYPLADDQQLRRVCDGAKVLRAAREGTLVAGLPGDLPVLLAPLDDVLDTYADLLVADGVHALVSGRADLANAAMEAAAGLGAPPDLRAIRTPRASSTVRVSAWALLPPGAGGDGVVEVADPAYAQLLMSDGAGDDTATARLAALLGGGEDDPPVPSLTGGRYDVADPEHADENLEAAMAADLRLRLQMLVDLAQTAVDEITGVDPNAPDAAANVRALTLPWGFGAGDAPNQPGNDLDLTPHELRTEGIGTLVERVKEAKAAAAGGGTVNAMRRAIRALAGRRELPVLPIVDRALLPSLRGAADLDRVWLEIVAAVRPRLAALEAWQLDDGTSDWPATVAAPGGSIDPWHSGGPVIVAYGPAAVAGNGVASKVAVAALDAWTDSVPSRRHTTSAAFGFNSPKARAPQAVLLAVPPNPDERLTASALLDVVLGTRELAHARAARPGDRDGLPYAMPGPLVHFTDSCSFLGGWPS